MRILLVNWMDPKHPDAGGAERHLAEIFGRLARSGHEITLVVAGFRGGARREPVGGLDVIRIGRRSTFALRAPSVVRRLLGTGAFDLLVEDLNKVPLPLPGTAVPRVVLTHHLWGRVAFFAAPAPIAALTWLAERCLKLLYREARFVAVSASTGWDLARLGIAADRVTVVPNAADPPAPPEDTGPRAPLPHFAYLGRLVRYKRVDRLLRAAAALAREGRPFRVTIAGEGPDGPRLQRLSRRLGLDGVVAFPGRITEAAKAALLGSAWANVLMSMKEGWGLTVLEAARQGTCSVVSPSAGLTEAVRHLEDGLWVPHHHLPSLEDALRYLMDRPDQMEALGRAARARAAARTWDDAAREMEEMLERARLPGSCNAPANRGV